MLTPLELSTLIAFCTPWADADLTWSLVSAGSAGAPYLISTAEGPLLDAPSRGTAEKLIVERFSAADANAPVVYFVGLTQYPVVASPGSVQLAKRLLDKCGNLELGYQRYVAAWEAATTGNPPPWIRTAMAFNLFRSARPDRETPYSAKAIDSLKGVARPAPAPPTDPVYHAVAADWSASLAQRHGTRGDGSEWTLLDGSTALARWAREGK